MDNECQDFQQGSFDKVVMNDVQGNQKDFSNTQQDCGASAVPTLPVQVQMMNGQPVVNGPNGPYVMVMMMPQDQQGSMPSQMSQMTPVCNFGDGGNMMVPMMNPQLVQTMSNQQQFVPDQQQFMQTMPASPNQQPQDQMQNRQQSQTMQYYSGGLMPWSSMPQPWIQNMQDQYQSEDSTQFPADEQNQDYSQNQYAHQQQVGQQYPQQSNHQQQLPQHQPAAQASQAQRWPPRRSAKGHNGKMAPQFQADSALANRLNELFNTEGDNWQWAVAQAEELLSDSGTVWRLSFHPAGCRQVQRALETFSQATAVRMASTLEGCVVQAIQSPHANYVLQKVIKVVPIEEVPWLVQELSDRCWELAQHEYGCRIFCRLLENASHSPAANALIGRLFESLDQLITHQYGHHVVECALEHGHPQQQKTIFQVLMADLLDFSRNTSGAHVIEKALHWGPWDERQSLVQALLNLPSEDLATLAKHPSGSIVVRAMQRVSGQVADKAQEILRRTSTSFGGPRRATRRPVRRQA